MSFLDNAHCPPEPHAEPLLACPTISLNRLRGTAPKHAVILANSPSQTPLQDTPASGLRQRPRQAGPDNSTGLRKPPRRKVSLHNLGASGASSGLSPLSRSSVQPLQNDSRIQAVPLQSRRSLSTPAFESPPPYSENGAVHPVTAPVETPPQMASDSDEDREGAMIYTSRQRPQSSSRPPSHMNSRSRIFGLASLNGTPRSRDKPICTTPGVQCAGETETETDEPSRHLPTTRILPPTGPLVPPTTVQQRLTPWLFEFSRLLSIVPAVFGTLYSLYRIYNPPSKSNLPGTRPPPERVDYFISALWAILTGYQCLHLTTGLLTRWRLYYPPLSTLVRLLALQGICWPATQLTLTILEHEKRPALVWAVIGTTTCMSRSVQIWVTSNLWWDSTAVPPPSSPHPLMTNRVDGDDDDDDDDDEDDDEDDDDGGAVLIEGGERRRRRGRRHVVGVGGVSSGINLSSLAPFPIPIPAPVVQAVDATAEEENRRGYWKRFGGGKWGGRRWDWKEVGVQCVLPAGIVYFIMAWAEQLRREWEWEMAAGGTR